MKVIAQIASFAVVAFAQPDDDGMRSDADGADLGVMDNNDSTSMSANVDNNDFNVAYSNVFHGLMDLWKMNEDISKTMFDINGTYVKLLSFYVHDSSDPSEVKKARIADDIDIALIQADVDKIIADKETYLNGAAKLENDVNELFIDKEMGGLGNYLNILKLQTETIIEINESIPVLELASKSFGNEDTVDFKAIEMKLQVLEGILVKLMDAIANKIVAMRSLLAEFGVEEVEPGALSFVSSLTRLNVRSLLGLTDPRIAMAA
jgi:hypothetical protein